MATPNLRDGVVSVIDMQTWKTIAHVPTLGPGFFLRSHEASRSSHSEPTRSSHAAASSSGAASRA